jgi:hypothetical protein
LIIVELVLVLVALAGLVLLVGSRARGGLGLCAGIGCFALATGLGSLIRIYPGAWLLAPLRNELALTAVIAGTFILLTRAASRLRPWIGRDRYLALAIGIPLATGLVWLATGAAELAWIWLVPAAALALTRRWPPAAIAALLPAALVLMPAQLREAAWNGFLPGAVPLAIWLAALGAPAVAAAAYLARRRGSGPGPLGTFVLVVGCGLAVIAGASVVLLARPACNSAQFERFSLACTSSAGWP